MILVFHWPFKISAAVPATASVHMTRAQPPRCHLHLFPGYSVIRFHKEGPNRDKSVVNLVRWWRPGIMMRGRQVNYTEGLHAKLAYDEAARAMKGLSL